MQVLVTFAIVVAVAAVLALPAILAILRKHPSWAAITFFTAALGWTGLGWIAALWWALRPPERRRRPKVWRARARKTGTTRIVEPATVPRHSSANDNMSTPGRSDTDDILPDVTASNTYEEWLEHGEALPEPGVEVAAKSDDRLSDGLAA